MDSTKLDLNLNLKKMANRDRTEVVNTYNKIGRNLNLILHNGKTQHKIKTETNREKEKEKTASNVVDSKGKL